MKIEIKNGVKQIDFCFSTYNDVWRISVNGNAIQTRPIGGNYSVTLTFSTMNQAVEAAKKRGLIPVEFDAKDLQQNIIVCAKG